MTSAVADSSRIAANGTKGPRAVHSQVEVLLILCVAAGFITLLGTIFWVGYSGTDDGSYIDAALRWYRHLPLVGHSHWELRYPVLFALDAGFRIFGVNELAVGVSMLAYLLGVTAVSVWMLQRWFERTASLIFIAIFCSMPGIIVLSTIANADIPEVFYVVASLAFYCAAREHAHPHRLLLCAGICAGIAFSTRETSAALVIAYGLLFLFRPGLSRRSFFVIAAGFTAVILMEMAYFEWTTGNPMSRFMLDVHHDVVDRSAVLKAGQVIDKEGNLSVGGNMGKLVSPLLIFFATQKYGLIFYLMLGMLPLVWSARWSESQKTMLGAVAALFVAWAAFVIFNSGLLYLVPRYFAVTSWAAAMVSAIGLARMRRQRPLLASGILAFTITASTVCLYLENTEPNQASRAVVDVAAQTHETIYTDAVTLRRGRFIAQIHGLADRIVAGRPKPGGLYVLAPDNLPVCQQENCGIGASDIATIEHGRKIKEITPQPRAIGGLIDELRLKPLIPHQIWKKLVQPNSGVIVYRVR